MTVVPPKMPDCTCSDPNQKTAVHWGVTDPPNSQLDLVDVHTVLWLISVPSVLQTSQVWPSLLLVLLTQIHHWGATHLDDAIILPSGNVPNSVSFSGTAGVMPSLIYLLFTFRCSTPTPCLNHSRVCCRAPENHMGTHKITEPWARAFWNYTSDWSAVNNFCLTEGCNWMITSILQETYVKVHLKHSSCKNTGQEFQ